VLRSLAVQNLALLAGGELELGPGFNVLTGETGAGKSLVVDSLALLAGARADADLVRDGAEALSVAGVFDLTGELAAKLDAAGIAVDGGELVVRREIGREGRNRVFVDDRPATVRLLQELAPALLRIHGQREELGLADPELQRAWLDRSGGAEGARLLAECSERFERHRELAARLERLAGDERARLERLDLLRFQAREIDDAQLRPGEEDELRQEREGLRHAEAIARALGAAYGGLIEDEGAALERLAAARHELDAVSAWEPLAAEVGAEIEELRARLAEAGRVLARRLGASEAEPGRLDRLEERLALLERLLRKYGGSSSAAIEHRTAIGRELAELEGDAASRDELEVATGAALEAYRQSALALSAARRAWGDRLSAAVERELADLALGRARFAVALERDRRAGSAVVVEGEPVEFGAGGVDRVVFQLAANVGEPLLPLVRVASGGELARVALALQLASRGDEDAGPTLVFDEIDAGMGGAQGAALGRKLRRLAKSGQIVAVTHLAQVASYGDRHHQVTKKVRAARTVAAVEALARPARVEEVARMLSGAKITGAAREQAQELLAAAERERR
jgi:DNA repair protein RecN (Recombination protein N)